MKEMAKNAIMSLAIVFVGLSCCSTVMGAERRYHNTTRNIFYRLIEENGSTGSPLNWDTFYDNYKKDSKEKNPSKFPILLPKHAPPIISDYKSIFGVLGGSRKNIMHQGNKHGGIDFYVKEGSSILAANDGKVVMSGKDKCAGNFLVIRHPRNIHATYLHIGDFKVARGDKVKRGQVIADAGRVIFTSCGGGMEHLHFQLSNEGPCFDCTGSWTYIGHYRSWINPHNFWTGGRGKPECFVDGKKYPKKWALTLPVACNL